MKQENETSFNREESNVERHGKNDNGVIENGMRVFLSFISVERFQT